MLLDGCVSGYRGPRRKFLLRLDEDRDARIGVFPQREEILVGALGLGFISRHSERSADLQVRQRADGIAHYDGAALNNFLELHGGFGTLMSGQIR